MDATRNTTTPSARRQAARDPEFIGLDNICAALTEIVGAPLDRTTVGRWLAVGVRSVRIEGRRIGRRWACRRSALVAFAIASGALSAEGSS